MPKPTKLTKAVLAKLAVGERVRDTEVRGLFAEHAARGVTLRFQKDITAESVGQKTTRTIKKTWGHYDAKRPDDIAEARKWALGLRAQITDGVDPREPAAPAGVLTVERMRDAYVEDLRIREKSERTVDDMIQLFKLYLTDWLPLPVTAITKDMVRERHAAVTSNHGKFAANHALKALRTCFNFTIAKTSVALPGNPCDAITFHKERPRKDKPGFVLPPVRGWIVKVRALKNPLRAAMHELGLFSGLRPGTLVALERAWLRLDDNAIVVPAPRMKARVEFALPLSGHMIDLVKRALAAGDLLHSGSPFLFPTRNEAGKLIATAVWKEKTIPGETGHLIRHLYSAECHTAGVSSVNRQLLLGQKVPGIEGVYLHERALFATLLAEQEKVTTHLLSLINPQPK